MQNTGEAKQEVTYSVMTSLDKELVQFDLCHVYSNYKKAKLQYNL